MGKAKGKPKERNIGIIGTKENKGNIKQTTSNTGLSPASTFV
jgi:hypothetical protein